MNLKVCMKIAKNALRGHWLRAMVVFAVWMSASAFLTLLESFALTASGQNNLSFSLIGGITVLVMAVFSLLVVSPIRLGYRRWIWQRAAGADPSVAEVLFAFGGVKSYLRIIKYKLLKFVYTFALGVVFWAPGAVYGTLIQSRITIPYAWLSNILLIAARVLVFAGTMVVIYQSLRYFVSDYVFFSEQNAKARDILRTASEITVGHRAEELVLVMRFTGWLLLCLLGFPLLYVSPYFEMTCATYGHCVCDQWQRTAESGSTDNTDNCEPKTQQTPSAPISDTQVFNPIRNDIN